MNRSDEIGQLAGALAKAQAAMKPAEQDSTNPFFNSRYADLGSIITVIQPVLAENGLSFTQLPLFDGEALSVETVLMHASGQWVSSTMAVSIREEKGLSMLQGMGKAITYLRRYGLAAMFGVYSDRDDDGNTGDEVTKQAPVKQTVEAVCPVCSGPMWDNRAKKMNPKAPDFKCKKKDCTGVIWPRDESKEEPSPVLVNEPLPAKPPADLKLWLMGTAKVKANEPEQTTGWRDGMIAAIDRLTEKDGHHVLFAWAFGNSTGSRKALTNGQIHALKDWLQLRKDEAGVWMPSENALTELMTAYPVAKEAYTPSEIPPGLKEAVEKNADSLHS